MNPTRSSRRLSDAMTGVTCSIKFRRMRSATTGKNVSCGAWPSGDGSAGAVLSAWISALKVERLVAIFSSSAPNRSVSAVTKSGRGSSPVTERASSLGVSSLAARARDFAVVVLFVGIRFVVVGGDAACAFVMNVLSYDNANPYC
jgi:hypothetical protein